MTVDDVASAPPSEADTPVEPVFTADAVRRAAEAKAGGDDYGSDSYRAALEPLLFSLQHEAELNARGRQELWTRIVNALANRLTLVAWEKAHPEAAAAPIEAPIVILGLGRTGSSILHETLAAAPGLRTPRVWQVRDFALAGEVADARADRRVQALDAEIARRNAVVEGYAAIHYEDAYVPMECVALTILDLVSVQFATVAWAPTYRRHLQSLDARGAYGWHRRALRYFQASAPGGRWVLKAPMHALYIDALLATYPDALLIQTHRHPAQVIGSMCSLYETLRRPWSARTDVAGQAAADAAYTAFGVERALRYRQSHPEVDGRVCDVSFCRFMTDQAGALADIFARLGLPFTDETRAATLDYLAHRPREKYGRHAYTLEQFGLDEEQVDGLFQDYLDRFQAWL